MAATSHELTFQWLPLEEAALIANSGLFERLRVGQGVLDREQFLEEVLAGRLQIVVLPDDCAALIHWGETQYGRTANIVTITGHMDVADFAMQCLEAAVVQRGGQAIFSVGYVGWERFAKRHGYQVERRMLMKKVLRLNGDASAHDEVLQ